LNNTVLNYIYPLIYYDTTIIIIIIIIDMLIEL